MSVPSSPTKKISGLLQVGQVLYDSSGNFKATIQRIFGDTPNRMVELVIKSPVGGIALDTLSMDQVHSCYWTRRELDELDVPRTGAPDRAERSATTSKVAPVVRGPSTLPAVTATLPHRSGAAVRRPFDVGDIVYYVVEKGEDYRCGPVVRVSEFMYDVATAHWAQVQTTSSTELRIWGNDVGRRFRVKPPTKTMTYVYTGNRVFHSMGGKMTTPMFRTYNGVILKAKPDKDWLLATTDNNVNITQGMLEGGFTRIGRREHGATSKVATLVDVAPQGLIEYL